MASSLVWTIGNDDHALYLTFDDGPHPEITNWVLDRLGAHNAKATFFIVGENAKRYPDIVERIIREGHHIGNHTYNHISGWKNSTFTYLKNTIICPEICQTGLFRPPYGRMTRNQAKALSKRYSLIMWDVLSGDFDRSIGPEKCTEKVLKHIKSGSIIVYHDSEKAEKNLKASLPVVLDILTKKGYAFKPIPYQLKST